MVGVLKEMGFRKAWIYEVIVTTADSLAPMGIWTDDFKTVDMDVYKTSKTHDSVIREGRFVVNFVDDISLFYDAVSKKAEREREITEKIPTLKHASGYLELEVVNVERLENRSRISSRILSYYIKSDIRLINRAESLALECLIGFTKNPNVEDLKEYLRVIKKVAPGSKYERLVETLLR